MSLASALRSRLPRRIDPLAAAAVAIAALIALPILSVALQAFSPGSTAFVHLVETRLPAQLGASLALAVMVALGTALIGTGAAWLVTMCRFPGRAVFALLLILPFAMPGYVIAFAYADFLGPAGPVQSGLRDLTGLSAREMWFPAIASLPGAAFVLSLTLYPYVYLLARASFSEQSVCQIEAARTLGRGPWAVFARVALPLARPAIAAGVALAVMETLADYGTLAHLGQQTLTVGIFRAWFAMGDPIAAARIALMLVLLVGLALWLERRARGAAAFHATTQRYRPLPAYRLNGPGAALAILACLVPVVLGFALPVAHLLDLLSGAWGDVRFEGFLTQARNAVLVAAAAGAAAVLLALVLAYAARTIRTRTTMAAAAIAGFAYAVPGAVIAVGALSPLAGFDHALDAFMRAQFGISTGLVLTGSIAALVFALVVRFLAVALNPIGAGLTRVTPNLDAAARAMGAGPLRRLARVHVPIIAPSLIAAFLLVFVDVLKELPATLILRPFGFDTLAVTAFQYAADERLGAAAAPALAIVAAGVIPCLILMREIGRRRAGSAEHN